MELFEEIIPGRMVAGAFMLRDRPRRPAALFRKKITALRRNVGPVLPRQPGSRCRSPLVRRRWRYRPAQRPHRILDLDEWLEASPAVASCIIWEDAAGLHPWPSWSGVWKAELRAAFALAMAGDSIPVAEVPVNQRTYGPTEWVFWTLLTTTDAWAYYKASVARSLAAQIGRELGWSITEYDALMLSELFDSRSMFRWHASPAGYLIDNGLHGFVTPAPPSFTLRFLQSHSLIGRTRMETIARIIDWCRANLMHVGDGWEVENIEANWQYRGIAPMVRVLNGTRDTRYPQSVNHNRTMGCWGTVGLLRAMLRVINIPVRLLTAGTHAQCWFMADDRYLDHGDNPYNGYSVAVPPIPAEEILINGEQYDAWFGPSCSDLVRDANVGRRMYELAIQYLPNTLLTLYCQDIAARKNHVEGGVFSDLSRFYPLPYLESIDLWGQMNVKIAGFGGCSGVPPFR